MEGVLITQFLHRNTQMYLRAMIVPYGRILLLQGLENFTGVHPHSLTVMGFLETHLYDIRNILLFHIVEIELLNSLNL